MMNEQLEELIKHATRARGPNKDAEFDKEYFAELIVAECAKACRAEADYYRKYIDDSEHEYYKAQALDRIGVVISNMFFGD